jgi:hypothetical protein
MTAKKNIKVECYTRNDKQFTKIVLEGTDIHTELEFPITKEDAKILADAFIEIWAHQLDR